MAEFFGTMISGTGKRWKTASISPHSWLKNPFLNILMSHAARCNYSQNEPVSTRVDVRPGVARVLVSVF